MQTWRHTLDAVVACYSRRPLAASSQGLRMLQGFAVWVLALLQPVAAPAVPAVPVMRAAQNGSGQALRPSAHAEAVCSRRDQSHARDFVCTQ